MTVRLRDRELQTSVELGTLSASNMDSVAEKELTKIGEIGYSMASNNDSTGEKEVTKVGEIGNPMKLGKNLTHFVLLELANNATLKKYQEFQEHLSQINGIGKKTKLSSLHLTMGILSIYGPVDVFTWIHADNRKCRVWRS